MRSCTSLDRPLRRSRLEEPGPGKSESSSCCSLLAVAPTNGGTSEGSGNEQSLDPRVDLSVQGCVVERVEREANVFRAQACALDTREHAPHLEREHARPAIAARVVRLGQAPEDAGNLVNLARREAVAKQRSRILQRLDRLGSPRRPPCVRPA